MICINALGVKISALCKKKNPATYSKSVFPTSAAFPQRYQILFSSWMLLRISFMSPVFADSKAAKRGGEQRKWEILLLKWESGLQIC